VLKKLGKLSEDNDRTVKAKIEQKWFSINNRKSRHWKRKL